MEVSFLNAALLGLLQGLTEFLPVSSSGHLVIMQNILGISEPLISFDLFLHLGTLIAVFIVFAKDIWYLITHLFSKPVAMIILSVIPAGLAGVFLEDIFEQVFSSVFFVGCALFVTGVLLWLSDNCYGDKDSNDMTVKDALIIGLFQAVAITPGISRSGSTIFGALLRGFDRKTAASFSFIISIPTILGAALLHGYKLIKETGALTIEPSYWLGMAVAAVSGYAAIKTFLALVQKQKLKYFSFYCWAMGAVILVWSVLPVLR